jgi:hypothetical protein
LPSVTFLHFPFLFFVFHSFLIHLFQIIVCKRHSQIHTYLTITYITHSYILHFIDQNHIIGTTNISQIRTRTENEITRNLTSKSDHRRRRHTLALEEELIGPSLAAVRPRASAGWEAAANLHASASLETRIGEATARPHVHASREAATS